MSHTYQRAYNQFQLRAKREEAGDQNFVHAQKIKARQLLKEMPLFPKWNGIDRYIDLRDRVLRNMRTELKEPRAERPVINAFFNGVSNIDNYKP